MALHQAASQLEGLSTTPQLDAELLLCFVLEIERVGLVTDPDRVLENDESARYASCVARRATGEPVAYILGEHEFYGRSFVVSSSVLTPRPETEQIVDIVKEYVAARREESDGNAVGDRGDGVGIGGDGSNDTRRSDGVRILDIGTGSGCIAVTLAAEIPGSTVLATDVSLGALGVARENAERHGADVEFLAGSLFEPIIARNEVFDVIVSNPPYVDLSSVDMSAPESVSLAFEPQGALEPLTVDGGSTLTGPENAFSLVEQLLVDAVRFLAEQFLFVIEIGADQGALALERAQSAFPDALCEIVQDLSGRDRFIVVRSK